MISNDDRWRSACLDEVFHALAQSPELSKVLVYKGARVLRLHLQEYIRASLDIDASLTNLAANIRMDASSLEDLRALAHRAIVGYFERQNPVRYVLQRSTIARRRKLGPHPRGWDVYWMDLEVQDLMVAAVSPNAPALRIDIAAPEVLSDRSVCSLELNGYFIRAITLERIAGEKLRAFLSSLPAYRRKLGPGHPELQPRVKDLYDLARILRVRPISARAFWLIAGQEFRLACESRGIDCDGTDTFKENWDTTATSYRADPTIPSDVKLEEVENTLSEVVAFLAASGVIPFQFSLPPLTP